MLGRFRQLTAQAIPWWPKLLAAGVGLFLFPGLAASQGIAAKKAPPGDDLHAPVFVSPQDSLSADSLMLPILIPAAPPGGLQADSVILEPIKWRLKKVDLQQRDTALLPGISYQLDRPREDLADQLSPLVAGPLFDLANVGHRQYIGLDGMPTTQSTIVLDGLDLGSRITGQTNLNLLGSFTLCDTLEQDVWSRSATGRPGGVIELQSLRATEPSVVTRIRSYEGFYEFLTTEGDFRRPLFNGGLTLAARQVFTGERTTGANYRGNLFFWNWDRHFGSWLLKLDQRILRDEHDQLGSYSNECRLQQSLLRARVIQQRSMLPVLFSFDAWRRNDSEKFVSSDTLLADRGRLRGLSGGAQSVFAEWRFDLSSSIEWQELSTPDWQDDIREHSTRLRVQGELPWDFHLLAKGLFGQRSDWDHLYHDFGLELQRGLPLPSVPEASVGLLLDSGRRSPTLEQLYVTRYPTLQEVATDPWWRGSSQTLVPNYSLEDQRWQRLELRLQSGKTVLGELNARAWYLVSRDESVLVSMNDSLRTWQNLDANYSGAQLWWTRTFGRHFSAFATQGVFECSKDFVSREFATSISEGGLRFHTCLFKGDLHWHTTLGVHYEYGGIDSAEADLWEAPDLWLYSEVRLRTFTFFYSVRNLLDAEIQRVAGYPELGREDRVGVRWTFYN